MLWIITPWIYSCPYHIMGLWKWFAKNDKWKSSFYSNLFDKITKIFIPPNDSLQFKLLKMVVRKELHECQNHCIKKGHNGTFKFGFSYSPHIEHNYLFNKKHTNGNTIDQIWRSKCCAILSNIIVALGSTFEHIITSSYWSFHLLKYAMKCEPYGKFNLNTKNVEQLGF